MKSSVMLSFPALCLAMALLAIAPAHAADASANAAAPCGKLVAAKETDGPDAGFVLRNGEQVDFISGGEVTRGTLLIFHDGPLFRAYWQPQRSEEKYVLANAGPGSVRLVSTPPQGVAANGGDPGIETQPLLVLSCPKL